MSKFYFAALCDVLNSSRDHANVLQAQAEIKANRRRALELAQIKRKAYLEKQFAVVDK